MHTYHGFGRSVLEARAFSADISAVLCAPDSLSFWGWLRVGCYPNGTLLREVELFPGVAILALCSIHVWRALRGAADPTSGHRLPVMAIRVLLIVAAFSAAGVVGVLALGPWQLDLGFIRASASSVRKPLLVGMTAVALATLLAPGLRAAARRPSMTGFYLIAAGATWLLALGPIVTFMGVPTGVEGPFAWLLALPGTNGLRVPARFWSITVLCLAVVAGTSLSATIRGRSKAVARGAVLLAGLGVVADGWIDRIPVQPAPSVAPGAALLEGATVIELPPDMSGRDIAATFRAVEGEWTTVNGYSGYVPSYYYAVKDAARAEDEHVLLPFQRTGELHVLVPRDAPRLTALVESQPDVTITARSSSMIQYRLPRRPSVSAPQGLGRRLVIAGLLSACSPPQLPLAIDGSESSLWECPPGASERTLTVDMGGSGTSFTVSGGTPWLVPQHLYVETSEDAAAWREAWSGRPLEEAIVAGKSNPIDLRLTLRFPGRSARYVRLSGEASEAGTSWSIAELEIWSGAAAVP